MSKRFGLVFMILGTLLIASALLLYLHNVREDQAAGESAQQVLQEMQSGLEPSPTPVVDVTPSPRPVKNSMTVVNIEGNDYIGYVSVPVIELELPVMADLTYDKLRVAPCRHAGAVFSDDLVIAAHNYDKHFGKLNQLQLGDEVVFTDMDSDLYRYEVVRMETVNPTDVERVLDSGNDLVMYTCTYGGKTRVVVYCDYID